MQSPCCPDLCARISENGRGIKALIFRINILDDNINSKLIQMYNRLFHFWNDRCFVEASVLHVLSLCIYMDVLIKCPCTDAIKVHVHDDVIKWKHFPRYWPFCGPAQRPVTRSFDVFFDLCLNKRLSKQSWGWWFETPSRPLWRHYNDQIDALTVTEYDDTRLYNP